MATTKLSRKIGQPARDRFPTHTPCAQPSPDWRVNIDGDLCMAGQAIAGPAQLAPDDADYWTACANVRLAAAAPVMLRALKIAHAALALIDCSDEQRQSAKLEAKAAIALASGGRT